MSDNYGKLPGLKDWVKSVVDNVKEAFSNASVKNRIRKEVGSIIPAEIGTGLMENDSLIVDAFLKAKNELDYQRKLDLIDEQTYYDNLEVLRDRYFTEGTENWAKYTAEVYAYQKKFLEREIKDMTEIYDTVSEYADARFEELRKKQQAFSDKLGSFGGIYNRNTVYMNGKTDVYYSTRDLVSDIETVKEYSGRLLKLKQVLSDGGFETADVSGFLNEVNSMGVAEGLSFMNYLLAKGEENAVSYAGLWRERNKIAEAVGDEAFKEEFEDAARDVAKTLKEEFKNAGYEIPEGFFESGTLSAQSFGRAFLTELDNQLVQIRMKIQEFPISIGGTSGDTYNTTNQYNITAQDSTDTVEQIKRYETVKRLAGV